MTRYTIPDGVVRSMNDPAAALEPHFAGDAAPNVPPPQQSAPVAQAYQAYEIPLPEIRVRPVVRYVITRYYHASPADGLPASSEVLAEVDNELRAEELAEALRVAQRSLLG